MTRHLGDARRTGLTLGSGAMAYSHGADTAPRGQSACNPGRYGLSSVRAVGWRGGGSERVNYERPYGSPHRLVALPEI